MNILRLQEVLNEKGMQGKELAVKIGVTPTTVSNIVQGNNFPKPETLIKIAEALEVDIRELFVSSKETDKKELFVKDENGTFKSVGFLKDQS